jgi:mono/diheme cytochrome c family protein
MFGRREPTTTRTSSRKGEFEMKTRVVRITGPVAIVFVAVLLGAGLASGQGNAPATFKAKCAACHGPDGKGDTATGKALGIHDFASADTQNKSDADLAEIITKGKDKMPAYGSSLKDTEIKDLVDYIRALGKKK